MKNYFESTVPVPRRGWVIIIVLGALLAAASVAAGMAMAPEREDMPVLLSNGEVITAPWYITVDGEKVALVESQEAARDVVMGVVEKYRSSGENVLDVEVEEQTSSEQMDIENGDVPPDILTEEEAEQVLVSGNDGDSYLTVRTTEEQTQQVAIEFRQEYKPNSDMYVGEKRVEVEGREGTKAVTKKIVRENGQPVEEEVLDEEIIREPQEEIILTGTKTYDGYGGGSGDYGDEDVSYDPDAVYEILATPLDTIHITSGFGQRWGRLHSGVDFGLAQGSAIYAADDGRVYFSGDGGGYGNLLKIDHGNGMQTYYAHCSALLVSSGQQVSRGQKIALVGSTGNSTGPHLHFEVIINGNCVDPLDFLKL